MPRHGMLLLGVLFTLIVGTASRPEVLAQATGGTLRIGLEGEPNHLDPDTAAMGWGPRLLHIFYDSLLALDATGQPRPSLAESWTVAPDGLSITFRLRRGVTFHDGSEFDAEAVKFNLERRMNPQNRSDALSDLVDLRSVEVVDRYTVRLALHRKSAPLLISLADFAGVIVSPMAVQNEGRDFGRRPVGTGPFAFARWVSNDHILATRNNNYWGEKAKIDYLIIRFYPTEHDRLTNLRDGQIDFVNTPPSKDVGALKAGRFPDLAYAARPSNGYHSIFMSAVNPPFDKKALREAVYYAVDREAMFRIAGQGVGELANAYGISPASFAYSKDYPYVKRDLAKAKQKLAEGGQPNGFEVTFYAAPGATYEAIAQMFQRQMAEVGIRVKIELLEIAQLVNKVVRQRDQQVYSLILGHRADLDGMHARRLMTGGAFNNARYSRPEIDAAFREARETYDLRGRTAAYAKAMELHDQDPVIIFLWFVPLDFAFNKKVKNFTIYPTLLQRINEVTVR